MEKKTKWMSSYHRSGNIIEIKIKDHSDRLVDQFKCNNNKAFETISKIIKNKYGFDPTPEIESIKESKNFEAEDFLNKDILW